MGCEPQWSVSSSIFSAFTSVHFQDHRLFSRTRTTDEEEDDKEEEDSLGVVRPQCGRQ